MGLLKCTFSFSSTTCAAQDKHPSMPRKQPQNSITKATNERIHSGKTNVSPETRTSNARDSARLKPSFIVLIRDKTQKRLKNSEIACKNVANYLLAKNLGLTFLYEIRSFRVGNWTKKVRFRTKQTD
jgi:hypothetical protein